MKKLIVAITFMAAMAFSAVAETNTFEYDKTAWTFTLDGAGATAVNGGDTTFGTDFSLSYAGFAGLSTQLDTGIRQGIAYSSNSEDVAGRTGLFADWNVQVYKKLYVYAGAEAAAAYGIGTTRWTAGPEVGVKLFVKENVYLFGQANYDFQLNDREDTDCDGVRYSIGCGVRF